MDLEQLKAARRNEKSGGYLFEKPPHEVVTDIKKRAGKMDCTSLLWRVLLVASSVIGMAGTSLLYGSGESALSKVGVMLIMIGAFLEVTSCLTLYFPFHRKCYELPRREFLEREREMIMARIRVWRRGVSWYALPIIVGASLWATARAESIQQAAGVIGMIVLLAVYGPWIGHRRITRELRPVLEEIDRELEELLIMPS